MIRTSVVLLRQAGACNRLDAALRWRAGHPEDELFPLKDLLEVPGLLVPDDTIWALRAVIPADKPERDRVARVFAVNCAQRVLERERAAGWEPDKRLWAAIEVARRFAFGDATEDELRAARGAAEVVRPAMRAAGSAAEAASWYAAWYASWEAAREAAREAAWYTSWDAAWDVERIQHARVLRALLEK